MKNVAVLMTVFGRRDFTVKCLTKFYDAMKLTPQINYDIYLLDDASIDDTYTVISNLFPSVNLIKGEGNLFWCRGMIEAWKIASKIEYDGFILLNNDSYIFEDGLSVLFSNSFSTGNNSIISGAFKSEFNEKATYGGRLKGQLINLAPNGELQKIEWLNGNFVLIPKKIFDKIGMLDSVFHHSIGDYDYGLRAIKAGFKVFLTEKYVGTCEEHYKKQDCYDKEISLYKRVKNFYSPLGDNPFQRFIFLNRHESFLKASSAFVITHLYVFFPIFLDWYESRKLRRAE